MKLIGCYIENFGGLRQYAQDFEDGLTVICQPNGFGKTTLAEFIRAMFYGFPRKTKTLGKRQKYLPWNGGKCGGHLTFEHEGQRYRIERTFGATPRGDSFTLIDLQTGQKSSRFSEEIGLELFGLDADSFERSTYLPQNRDVGPLNTDSIRAKLGDLVEDSGDVGNFEKALAALRTRRSAYVPYRGAGGAVAEDAAMVTRVQRELDSAESSGAELRLVTEQVAAMEAEQKTLAGEIAGIRNRITACAQAEARAARRREHDRLETALQGTRAELAALREKYPRGLPQQEEINEILPVVERAAILENQQVSGPADDHAQEIVEEHQARFGSGIPGEEDFLRHRKEADEIAALNARLEACCLSDGDGAELAAAEAFFSPGLPTENTLNHQAQCLAEAERLRRENLRLAAQPEELKKEKKSALTPVLLAVGVLGVILGIVLLALGQFAIGGAALGVGVVALLAAVYVSLRAMVARSAGGVSPQLQAIIRENDLQAAAKENDVRAFTSRYCPDISDPAQALRQIRDTAARLTALRGRREALKTQADSLTAQRDTQWASVKGFLNQYGMDAAPERAFELLAVLQRACDTYVQAREKLADRDERLRRHHLALTAAQAELAAFREKYGVALGDRVQVLQLRDDAGRLEQLTFDAAEQADQLERFRQENGDILAAPAEEIPDPEQLKRTEAQLLARQKDLTEELLRQRQKQRRLWDEADRIPALRDELQKWQEKKISDQKRAETLDDTMDYLARAKDNLASSYMGPIRESFSGLMERMLGQQREGILLSPELEIKLERGGQVRELGYFSAGQTDLVMLCMRLALVDALFTGVKPFVILDDPFVNLDDTNTREALELLRELSRDRQIVYLVCNSSRV
ncbi:MAG: AAA family ATPase [Oscillospiraceae bacterium]|nr:AAA family ATPase [Oscillospiraceae bacterium]